MAGDVIGWQGMGKPDFSQCAKLFYRFPADLREGLNRSQEKVLIWTIFLSWTTAFHRGRTGGIMSFSEAWVGMRFGRSRWTVARALAKLEEWTLVKRIRRTPKRDGTFQTNLIALSARLTGLLSAQSTQVIDKSPCSKSAPQRIGKKDKQERTATFKQSASPSLSSSIPNSRREMDADTQTEERRVEKGTLMKLYLQLKGK